MFNLLSGDQSQAIRDPIWKHIYIPKQLAPLLDTVPFIKLQGIRQLGPASLVYPGATHTRFNHSLGVFHIAHRFVDRIISQPLSSEICTEEGILAFLAAALSHDLGHFPYTHSLKELPLREHESLTAELIQTGRIAVLLTRAGIDPELVAKIVDESLPCSSEELLLYRRMLSGVLDPDKLDYLNRDAYFCGVPYGIQDLDYILAQLLLVRTKTGMPSIAVRESGVSSLEHILFSKYLMYKAVYWHKQVRAATSMIKRALWQALTQELLKPDDLYNLDDSSFFERARILPAPIQDLISFVRGGHLYPCVYEVPFDSKNGHHRTLNNLTERAEREKQLEELCMESSRGVHKGTSVVVDVPEAVSFEADMPVQGNGEQVAYLDSQTVFTRPMVSNFTTSLRIIRVFAHPDISDNFRRRRDMISKILNGEPSNLG